MLDWINALAEVDPLTVIFSFVTVILTGGIGAAIVGAISANRRGIKGDALVREQNGIEGLGKLTDAQGAYIDKLEKRLDEVEKDFKIQLSAISAKLTREIKYSNTLIKTLSAHNVPIPARPDE
jgi:hypothetical protein